MSVAMRADPRMRVADFIDRVRSYPDAERWELLDGMPTLMAPSGERLQVVVARRYASTSP